MAEKTGQENIEYRVTARKWRPKNFEEVSSQEFITKTLKNAVKNNRISHAYLFSGPRGVGKTTVARILAKSLNCLNRKADGTPCNVCESCKEINNDNRNHPDVFEIDGASNRNIEDVRELKEKVKYGPVRSKYKIFIIDEVHMLTGASFNALLKTLEEPPDYVVFIFATTSPERVPLTILGRCQKFDFKRISIEENTSRLKFIAENENIKIDDESLFFIAKKGDGSMRDSQGLFDMSAAYCDNNITFEKLKSFFNLTDSDLYFRITDFIKAKDGNGLLLCFDDLMNKGYDMQTFLEGLTEHFRNMLVASSTNSADLIIESDSVKNRYKNYINKFSELEIINSLKLIFQTEEVFKYSSNQRTLIEALLVELIKFTDTKEISRLIEELKHLSNNSKSNSVSLSDAKTEKKYTAENVKTIITPESKITPQNNISSEYAADAKTPASPENNYVKNSEIILPVSDDIRVQWDSIKSQIRNERKWVYSLVKDSVFDTDEKNNYRLKIDDSYYELLESHKDYLNGKISNYLGHPVNVALVKFSEITSSPVISHNPGNSPGEREQGNYEKIRSILVNEFNAKEVR